MNRTVNFLKYRFIMFALSLLLIAGGISSIIVRGGLNYGIDFKAGLNQRIQIAPVAFLLSYTGEGTAVLRIEAGALTVSVQGPQGDESYRFPFEEYTTMGSVADEISQIPRLRVDLSASRTADSRRIISLNFPLNIVEESIAVNFEVIDQNGIFAPIEDVREALAADIPNPQIQIVGAPVRQEFSIRVEDSEGAKNFSEDMSQRIQTSLLNAFGREQVIVNQTDYVGPSFSQALGEQSAILGTFALGLILIYIWVRFQLAYAVSAIAALVHDILVMIGFIGAFQIELSTATIAAILTIIGYSLNDTIVIFDRVRENTNLLRDSDRRTIINTSISQSISRTLMTSITTLLAVIPIYIFGSGVIKDFALSLIIGIVVGTYSSIYIASPIFLGWMNAVTARHKARDAKKFGIQPSPGDKKKPETPKEESDLPVDEKKATTSSPEVVRKQPRRSHGTKKKRKKRR